MAKKDKLKEKLLSGEADRNFGFDELCTLMRRLGFSEHKGKGSYRIFYREDIEEIITLQTAGS